MSGQLRTHQAIAIRAPAPRSQRQGRRCPFGRGGGTSAIILRLTNQLALFAFWWTSSEVSDLGSVRGTVFGRLVGSTVRPSGS